VLCCFFDFGDFFRIFLCFIEILFFSFLMALVRNKHILPFQVCFSIVCIIMEFIYSLLLWQSS
jgi:hypothetical protein